MLRREKSDSILVFDAKNKPLNHIQQYPQFRQDACPGLACDTCISTREDIVGRKQKLHAICLEPFRWPLHQVLE